MADPLVDAVVAAFRAEGMTGLPEDIERFARAAVEAMRPGPGDFGYGDLPKLSKLDPEWQRYVEHLEALLSRARLEPDTSEVEAVARVLRNGLPHDGSDADCAVDNDAREAILALDTYRARAGKGHAVETVAKALGRYDAPEHWDWREYEEPARMVVEALGTHRSLQVEVRPGRRPFDLSKVSPQGEDHEAFEDATAAFADASGFHLYRQVRDGLRAALPHLSRVSSPLELRIPCSQCGQAVYEKVCRMVCPSCGDDISRPSPPERNTERLVEALREIRRRTAPQGDAGNRAAYELSGTALAEFPDAPKETNE